MSKIAFVFPGQGTQYVGMGIDFYESIPEYKQILDSSCDILGFDLKKVCFYGTEDELKKTNITQPAVAVMSIGIYEIIKNKINPDFVAGHSLGEITSFYISGAINFEDTLKIIKKRAELMEEVGQKTKGKMCAIIGLEKEEIEDICKSVKNGFVGIANYNCPKQIVITGEEDAVNVAKIMASEKGALKVVDLEVSGPFHSYFMKPAGELLEKELNNIQINKPRIPIVLNTTAKKTDNPSLIREEIPKQIYSSVLWEQSIRELINEGVNTFYEIGPGKVLSGLIKRIDKNKNTINFNSINTLKENGVI